MLPVEALQRALAGVDIPGDEEWLRRLSDEAVEAAKRHNPTGGQKGTWVWPRTPSISVAVVLAHALLDLPGNAFADAGYSDGCERRAVEFLTLLGMRAGN